MPSARRRLVLNSRLCPKKLASARFSLFSKNHQPTFTATNVIVSLPKISITFTATL
jgi:hypothetical protein